MKNIIIYYGPKIGYEKILPAQKKTLAEIITAHDDKLNTHVLLVKHEGKNPPKQILTQLQQTYPKIIKVKKYKYKSFTYVLLIIKT